MKTLSALAFDYGTKSIGVAYGQSLTGTGNELTPLPARDGVPNWDQIQSLLKEWQPDFVVVGLPLNMDDSASELSQRARKFAQRIHGRFGIKVELYDERLSTREAKEEAKRRGHKGNYASKPIDSIAARLILEGWWQQLAADPKP